MKRWIALTLLGISPTIEAEKYIDSSDDLKPLALTSHFTSDASDAVKQVKMLGVYPGMTVDELNKHYKHRIQVENYYAPSDEFYSAKFGFLAPNYTQVTHRIFKEVGVSYMMFIESTRYKGRVDLIRFQITDLPKFKAVFHHEINNFGEFDAYVTRRFHEYPKTVFNYEMKLNIPMTEEERSVKDANDLRKRSAQILETREKVSETFK